MPHARPWRYARGVTATTLPIPTDDGDLPGLLWLPPNGARADRPVPGLVVLQEIFGLSAYLQRRCAQLAELGCELSDCLHEGEPGCRLDAARIHPQRLASYRRLLEALRD